MTTQQEATSRLRDSFVLGSPRETTSPGLAAGSSMTPVWNGWTLPAPVRARLHVPVRGRTTDGHVIFQESLPRTCVRGGPRETENIEDFPEPDGDGRRIGREGEVGREGERRVEIGRSTIGERRAGGARGRGRNVSICMDSSLHGDTYGMRLWRREGACAPRFDVR